MEVNNINYQLNALLQVIQIYSDLDSDLYLNKSDVKRLDDYIDTQNEKIKQLSKALVNVTKELEELEL